MGYGRKLDQVAGALSRLLHLRPAKINTLADLEQYLDLPADEMFPEPPRIHDMRVDHTLLRRLTRATTLSWRSSHAVRCARYLERHEGEYHRNLTAWARWIRPDARMRRTCLVYVHGWLEPGPWAEEATLFRRWARELDVDLVHVALPFHGRRNPRGALFSGEFFWTADLVRSIEGVRQAVSDARAVIAWLREQGYQRVGVSGLSLGGSIVMILACLDPSPDFIVPMIGHLELEDAVEEAPILWRMKHDLESWGIDRAQRMEIFRRVGLSHYRPTLEAGRQLWIEGDDDLYINPELVRRQWEDWGHPEIYWFSGGHMTFPLHVGKITRRMRDFLDALPASER